MDIAQLLKTALVDNDRTRARSMQTELGASSVGGCRRQAWNIINQTPKTNFNTDSLAAMFGTAFHEMISNAIKQADPFDDFLVEEEFSTPDLKGHIDLYIKSTKQVVDWKTITTKKLADFPTNQQKIQVMLYGYLLEENGYEVDSVSLVAICRDGKMADTKVWSAPYDRNIALAGIEWVKQLKEMKEPPLPEKDWYFCKNFCEYFDESGVVGCPSKSGAKR